jgi:hypothetical protein
VKGEQTLGWLQPPLALVILSRFLIHGAADVWPAVRQHSETDGNPTANNMHSSALVMRDE